MKANLDVTHIANAMTTIAQSLEKFESQTTNKFVNLRSDIVAELTNITTQVQIAHL